MKKILFIEDEESLQKTVGEILKQEGFEVLEALDGDSGLAIAKNKNPDLILLDLVLPKKDGFEVLKHLKEDSGTNHIKVVVLTNLEGSGDVERALELGATTYLVKANYNLEELVQKVKDLVNEG